MSYPQTPPAGALAEKTGLDHVFAFSPSKRGPPLLSTPCFPSTKPVTPFLRQNAEPGHR